MGGLGLGRAGGRSWVPALGLPTLLCGGAFGTALLLGAGHLRPVTSTGFPFGDVASNALLTFPVTVVILMGQEIGWHGFLLPRLAQLTGQRRAALLAGFAQGCFHLPLILTANTYDTVGPRWSRRRSLC